MENVPIIMERKKIMENDISKWRKIFMFFFNISPGAVGYLMLSNTLACHHSTLFWLNLI